MRGPIDYIIVGFEGNKFDGSILKELDRVVSDGTIAVLDLGLIVKDDKGKVSAMELSEAQDKAIAEFAKDKNLQSGLISDDDVAEVGEILENNCSAGLLVVEQLWAKGLKKAIVDAGGVLVAEGRIHPDAAAELSDEKGGK